MKAQILTAYFLIINLVTLAVYGIDKRRAKKQQWRIPEATLLWLAVLGGSVGAIGGMKWFHHKTKHKKFRYGLPAILIGQLILAAYLWLSGIHG